ncbi:MAG: hypothetical protein JKX88_08125 [Marinicaulis sp.]|nr:hypothetical protein [Marinicaulis sp.]
MNITLGLILAALTIAVLRYPLSSRGPRRSLLWLLLPTAFFIVDVIQLYTGTIILSEWVGNTIVGALNTFFGNVTPKGWRPDIFTDFIGWMTMVSISLAGVSAAIFWARGHRIHAAALGFLLIIANPLNLLYFGYYALGEFI